jgi:hypothetical protein
LEVGEINPAASLIQGLLAVAVELVRVIQGRRPVE